jgi:hypothetical protein
MASVALQRWQSRAQAALDEIAVVHSAVGVGRGRRYATLQVNYAYAVLVSSHFQGFCRDLHSEAVDVLVEAIQPPALATVVHAALVQARKLDSGNPTPGNLGADFSRLGMPFWPTVHALDLRNAEHQRRLEHLNDWRNAIAHHDWKKVGPALQLRTVQSWRLSCTALAKAFDAAVGHHLAGLVARQPW